MYKQEKSLRIPYITTNNGKELKPFVILQSKRKNRQPSKLATLKR